MYMYVHVPYMYMYCLIKSFLWSRHNTAFVVLSDRKAFISKGRLKCVGSSLYLKNKFGVGYHLG